MEDFDVVTGPAPSRMPARVNAPAPRPSPQGEGEKTKSVPSPRRGPSTGVQEGQGEGAA
jgi:hypothetical protein